MNLFKKKKKELTEDEIIEKELDEEFKEPNLFNLKEIINTIKTKTDDDIEYESLLTEEEKQEELKQKQEDKKFMIKAFSILAGIFLVVIVVGVFFIKDNKSDLYKITEPLLKDYYKNKYNEKVTFKSLEYLSIDDKKTDLVLATTRDNKHIMSINNELIGDDISNNISKELVTKINSELPNFGILNSEINIAYKDYYDKYNKRLDYINVIPNLKLDELIESKKLTVEYIAFYNGIIDNNVVLNILNNYSDDSKFYFIRLDNGLPTKLDVIDKINQFNINITGNREVEKEVFIYDLDRTHNAVNTVRFSRYANNTIEEYPNYTLKNIFKIELESDYSYSKKESIGNYFLIKMNNINKNNLLQVDYSESDHTFFEINIDNYNNFIIINFGGSSYLIGNNEVTFGTLEENKSFLCNLGLC